MGGSNMIDDEWEIADCGNDLRRTMVLVGKTGNGKSATGNSILGAKAFISEFNCAGVTSTCEMRTTLAKDGRTLNIIDTPGLFDFSAGSEFIGKEIMKCIDLAQDGIHAVLVCFSVRSRFSKDEEAAIQSLQSFFGKKITDYMIAVFTGGDDLEGAGMTLDQYIGRNCPEPLQKFLQLCKHRVVLFDNKTTNKIKQAKQVNELLYLVDSVVKDNGGRPFSNNVFAELKEGALKLLDEEKEVESMQGCSEQQILELKNALYKSYDDQLARIVATIEEKLKYSVERLEKQLAEEQAARKEAVKTAGEAQKRSDDEITKLKDALEKARKESEEFRNRANASKCAIL